jgi:hypothetical protein
LPFTPRSEKKFFDDMRAQRQLEQEARFFKVGFVLLLYLFWYLVFFCCFTIEFIPEDGQEWRDCDEAGGSFSRQAQDGMGWRRVRVGVRGRGELCDKEGGWGAGQQETRSMTMVNLLSLTHSGDEEG